MDKIQAPRMCQDKELADTGPDLSPIRVGVKTPLAFSRDCIGSRNKQCTGMQTVASHDLEQGESYYLHGWGYEEVHAYT